MTRCKDNIPIGGFQEGGCMTRPDSLSSNVAYMKSVFYLLLGLLILHLLISLVFIVNPPFLKNTRISKIYKTYLLPGPFFKEDRIVNSYTLYVSWKIDKAWTTPINAAFNSFNQYQSRFHPKYLYRNRLERTLYLRLFSEQGLSNHEILQRKEFSDLRKYLSDNYIPPTADSIRMVFVSKRAKDYDVKVDSIYLILSK